MRFAFTEDQIALHDAVRDLLNDHSNAAQLREAWGNETGRTASAWGALHAMGAIDAMRAEADGGLGFNEVDAILIAEASGRVALAEPIIETMMVAAPLNLVTIGLSAAVVTHESPFAPWADTAEVIIELAADGIRSRHRQDTTLTPRSSVDGARRLFAVSPNTEVAPASTEVALAFRRGALGTAAQLCGLSETMITVTVAYAKERKQFGVPIGSFQAVKHHLANARTKLEFARPLVYRAAASLRDRDAEAGVHVSMAKAAASDAAMVAAKASLQCHGAIGYTTEADLHLYMKRAWALGGSWGDAAWHRRQITNHLERAPIGER